MFVEVIKILRVRDDSLFTHVKHYTITFNANILSRQCVAIIVLDIGAGVNKVEMTNHPGFSWDKRFQAYGTWSSKTR